MASGLPVIAAPSAGASCFIENGKNGIVLKSSSDLEGMTAALRQFEVDRSYAKQLGLAAREAAERWTWENMARRYESVFDRIIAEKRGAGMPAGAAAAVI
jgi:glycosyltransferase involved in cell wall biosynthesis